MSFDAYLNDPWLLRLYRNGKEWNTIGIVIHNNYDERIMGMMGSLDLQKVGVYYGCGFNSVFRLKMQNYILNIAPPDLCELHLPREVRILKAILTQTCFLRAITNVYSMDGDDEDKDLVVMIIDNTRTSLDFGGLMEILSDHDKRIHVMITLNVREDGNGNKIMVKIPPELIREYYNEICGIIKKSAYGAWEKGAEYFNNILNKPFKKEDAESNCCDSVETINK